MKDIFTPPTQKPLNATAIAIFDILVGYPEGLSTCQLGARLQKEYSTISKQLIILHKQGWVFRSAMDRKTIIYQARLRE